jgi:hypothetical protein
MAAATAPAGGGPAAGVHPAAHPLAPRQAPNGVDDAFEVAPMAGGAWAILNRVPLKDIAERVRAAPTAAVRGVAGAPCWQAASVAHAPADHAGARPPPAAGRICAR